MLILKHTTISDVKPTLSNTNSIRRLSLNCATTKITNSGHLTYQKKLRDCLEPSASRLQNEALKAVLI